MTHFAREDGDALYELAREEGLEEQCRERRKLTTDGLDARRDYVRLLCARNLEVAARISLLDEAFGGSLHPYLLNFMKLLTGRGAMDYFFECAEVYRTRFNEDHGIARATAVSAAPLTPEQTRALVQKLEKISGKRIELNTRVDASLIGGMQVDLEGRRYDNSIRTRLERMRRTLIESE